MARRLDLGRPPSSAGASEVPGQLSQRGDHKPQGSLPPHQATGQGMGVTGCLVTSLAQGHTVGIWESQDGNPHWMDPEACGTRAI